MGPPSLAPLLAGCLILGAIAAPAVGLLDLMRTAQSLGDTRAAITTLRSWHPAPRARILARDGETIGYAGTKPFAYTPMEAISPFLPEAVTTAEDRTFDSNPGIDLYGMARAADSWLEGQREGASTITQQLAKQVFLDGSSATWRLKREQIVLALRIAREIPKRRVMEIYLNTVPFGRDTTGIAEAASRYFSTRPEDLTLAQSALLAAIIRAPTRLDPLRHPVAAMERRNWVLDEMLKRGAIDQASHDAARATEMELRQGTSRPQTTPGTEDPGASGNPYGWATDLATRGLATDTMLDDIKTTLDPTAQAILERDFATGLARYEAGLRRPALAWGRSRCGTPLPTPPDDVASATPEWTEPGRVCGHGSRIETGYGSRALDLRHALNWMPSPGSAGLKDGDMVMQGDPAPDGLPLILPPVRLNGSMVLANGRTGDVLAVVGGVRWTPTGFNRAVSAIRPPGSAVKPFVYLSAIERGWTPDDVVYDIPTTILAAGGPWSPSNDDNSVAGAIPLRRALAQSRNLATVNLSNSIGFEAATRHLLSTGITTDASHPAAVLGAIGTTTWRMTQAATLLVNDGQEQTLRISGAAAPLAPADTTPEAAGKVREMMRDVLKPGGTASAEQPIADRLESHGFTPAAKTGTTSDFTDVWTIALAGPYVLVIQAGYDAPKQIARNAFAADIVAPIAFNVLDHYLLEGTRQ